MRIDQCINQSKPGDIVNIYGGNPAQSRYFMDVLKVVKHKKLKARVWTNHHIQSFSNKDLDYFINELVIWCPSPEKALFNEFCGRAYFDQFQAALKSIRVKKRLSFKVTALSFEQLTEFHDLVIAAGAQGLLLYYPKEFSAEQRRYIKRFKRVNHMQVMPLTNAKTPHCIGVPNSIGSFHFEWFDWLNAIRSSIKKTPVLRYTI
tara:strand:- start:335 stop:946 length:612 start_codon:yes stop_codon:yes gene_type:complete